MAPADRDPSTCELVIDVDFRGEFLCPKLESREMARAGHGAHGQRRRPEPHT